MVETILKDFEHPDEIREFPLGRFEIVHVAGVTFGRATYQPGWRWSEHNAPYSRNAIMPCALRPQPAMKIFITLPQ